MDEDRSRPTGHVQQVGTAHLICLGRARARRRGRIAELAYSPAVKLLRRALVAVSVAGIIAAAMRVRGKGGTPPGHGGWQPIELSER